MQVLIPPFARVYSNASRAPLQGPIVYRSAYEITACFEPLQWSREAYEEGKPLVVEIVNPDGVPKEKYIGTITYCEPAFFEGVLVTLELQLHKALLAS